MMLMNPNRKAVSILLGKVKTSPFVQKESAPQQAVGSPSDALPTDASYGLEACAAKMLSCLEAKDAKGLSSALKDFIDMHSSESQSAPEELNA